MRIKTWSTCDIITLVLESLLRSVSLLSPGPAVPLATWDSLCSVTWSGTSLRPFLDVLTWARTSSFLSPLQFVSPSPAETVVNTLTTDFLFKEISFTGLFFGARMFGSWIFLVSPSLHLKLWKYVRVMRPWSLWANSHQVPCSFFVFLVQSHALRLHWVSWEVKTVRQNIRA